MMLGSIKPTTSTGVANLGNAFGTLADFERDILARMALAIRAALLLKCLREIVDLLAQFLVFGDRLFKNAGLNVCRSKRASEFSFERGG